MFREQYNPDRCANVESEAIKLERLYQCVLESDSDRLSTIDTLGADENCEFVSASASHKSALWCLAQQASTDLCQQAIACTMTKGFIHIP
jgi:hypothetical protein